MNSTEPYPYVVAWGKMIGSSAELIEEQLKKARDEEAPGNACYPTGTHWVTTEELMPLALENLQKHVAAP